MAKCPECRRPIGRVVEFTRQQVRIPMPPKGVIHMLMTLELMYAARERPVLCGADAIAAEEAERDFRVEVAKRWPELRDLVWRAIGRSVSPRPGGSPCSGPSSSS